MSLNLNRWLIAVVSSLCVVPAGAFAQAVDAPLQEIQPASGAFSRGAPPPDWARLAPVLGAAGRAMVVHLSDVHLRVAPTQAYVGQHHKVRGESELAAAAFRKAVDKGVTMYIEHAAATFELQRTEAR